MVDKESQPRTDPDPRKRHGRFCAECHQRIVRGEFEGKVLHDELLRDGVIVTTKLVTIPDALIIQCHNRDFHTRAINADSNYLRLRRHSCVARRQ